MIKVFIFGISGRMGRAVCDCIQGRKDITVAGGFDQINLGGAPVFDDVSKIDVDFDIIIDFSRPETLKSLITLVEKKPVPIVFAVTGYDSEQLEKIKLLSRVMPVFMSGNMSFGVHVLLDLAARATKNLAGNADIEIIEKHHNQKVDAPSGTALMIADEVKSALPAQSEILYGRAGEQCKRGQNEITVHAVRGGNIVGEHEILFCSGDEIISIKHTALSRKIFAEGALKAAEFLINQKSGMYNMKNVIV